MTTTVATLQRISKHEFVRNTTRWLKESPIIITNNGNDEYLINKINVTNVATDIPRQPPYVATDEIRLVSVYNYGCGCFKEPNKSLCPKHGRY